MEAKLSNGEDVIIFCATPPAGIPRLVIHWVVKDRMFTYELESKIDTITFQVPEYLLSLIINGDDSGLSDKEIKQWENFADSLTDDEFKSGLWSYDSEDNEAYFSHINDVTNLGGNVVDIQWVIMP